MRAWLDGYYHERIHGSTKRSPREKFEASVRARKRRPLTELNELFLWEETRSVDKACCVKLDGNVYEVDRALATKRVQLRYDPFDLTTVQVWLEDKRYADAKPVELSRRRKKKPDEPTPQPQEPEESLSFLELAESKRQAAWQEDELRYASKGGERP